MKFSYVQGHWPTAAFLGALAAGDYQGYGSVGVYNTLRRRRDCIIQSLAQLHIAGVR